MSSLDFVEEVPNPDHVHVLEVVNEEEGQRVEVAPFIGRFLLDHQARKRTDFPDVYPFPRETASGGLIYIVLFAYLATT